MRLCFVFDGIGCGGIERVGVDYCNALVSIGHDITVVNLAPSKNDFVSQLSEGISYIERTLPREVAPERYCTLTKRYPWGRFAYPVVFLACTALIAAGKPAFRRGLNSFDAAIAFSGHYNDLTFVASGCVGAKTSVAWLHGGLNGYALISDGYLNLYKHFDGLVCLSDEGIEEFEYSNSYLNLNVRKIYNPIRIRDKDVSREVGARILEQCGDFALMVARLDYPQKDPFTAIEAINEVNLCYGHELNLVIVGDGPCRSEVERCIDELDMRGKVTLVGYDSNPAPYYAASKIVVHASAAAEGLPTVMLEGMAFGKPVVATEARTGPKEILGNNEYGLLCRVKDSKDMARQISSLLDDEDLYSHYAAKSIERIKDFSSEQAVSKLLNYLDELMRAKMPNGGCR